MIGAVVLNRMASTQQSVLDRYDILARQLYPARKNLPGKFLGLFGGGKRKAYENLCKQLAKPGTKLN
jgi:hypothetical protein